MTKIEEAIEVAITHFRNYLRTQGFAFDAETEQSLREYIMEDERKEQILTALGKGEKTLEDLTEGSNKLAALCLKAARSKGRTNVTRQDFEETCAILPPCAAWPYCKPPLP